MLKTNGLAGVLPKALTAPVAGILRSTLVEAGLGTPPLAVCVVLTITDFVTGPIAALAMASRRGLANCFGGKPGKRGTLCGL